MRQVVVGFSKSKKKFPIGSWLIRLYQGFTSYSHVYIRLLVTPKFPSDKIIHAAEGAVNHWAEPNFHSRNKTVEDFVIDIPDELYIKLRDEIFHSKAGELYGFKQNLGIALVQLLKNIGIKTKNPWKNGWNCSEFVYIVLKEIFSEEVKHLNKDIVTPKDINIVLSRLKKQGKINNYSIKE